MPSKYKPTRDRKQRRAPKGIDAAQSEGISGIPSARNTPPAVDPNVDIIIPLTGAEKKEKRRIELRGEMKEGQPKMSSKKQKRLNKYIVCRSYNHYHSVHDTDILPLNRKINLRRRKE